MDPGGRGRRDARRTVQARPGQDPGTRTSSSREAFATWLDLGDNAFALLGEVLDTAPIALRRLTRIEPEALGTLKEGQRKAWALERMPKPVRVELCDLAVAGGWAGRAMSFGRPVSSTGRSCVKVSGGASTISCSFSRLTFDKPIALHWPSTTRSKACEVSTDVTPES
jgi:hypothetical protein